MNGKLMLCIDQYGNHFWAQSVINLRKQIGLGGSRVAKMYVDKKDGRTMHCGYIVGKHWLTAYLPFEREA